MNSTELLKLAEVRALATSGEARRIREAARISQAHIGEACGVTAATVSRWESGGRLPYGEPALRYLAILDALRSMTAVAS